MTLSFCENFQIMDNPITLADALRRFRRSKDWTQDQIAKKLGLKRTTYTAYEQSIASPPAQVLKDLRQLGFDDVSPPLAVAPLMLVPLRFIGSVSASSKADWTEPLDVEDMEYVPPEMVEKGRFCCRIESDSCFDLLWPGDIAVFQRSDVPKLNYVILFRAFDNRITVKQVKHNGSDFILHPLNPKYQDEIAEGSCIGFLVGIVRQQGSRRVTVYDSHGILP